VRTQPAAVVGAVLRGDLDEPDDARVELGELLGRHPQLDVLAATDLVRLIA
jgi:hypothetical protein